MYIFWNPDEFMEVKSMLKKRMMICDVDGFEIVLSAHNQIKESGIDLTRYYDIQTP